MREEISLNTINWKLNKTGLEPGVKEGFELTLNTTDWKLNKIRPGHGEREGFHKRSFGEALGWMDATVPGDVHSTLVDAGAIPDPYIGRNNQRNKWVIEYEWWYRKRFEVSERWKGRRIRLVFKGVDYDAVFWLNDKKIGCHQGMFSHIVFDITNIVNYKTENILAIRLSPPPRNRIEVGGRKCSLGYGLDYAPELITIGIWDEVKLISTNRIYIEDVHIISNLKGEMAVLKVTITYLGTKREKVTSFIRLKGKNFDSPVYEKKIRNDTKTGRNTLNVELVIPKPRLWWPHDMGEQNLYEMEVSIYRNKECLDQITETIGVREIKMVKNPGAPRDAYPWTFIINGKKEFAKGANWTNTDLLLGSLNKDRYERLVKLAKDANMNILRIHGWHLRERKEFYDICDREGIMVWQEFAFCNAYFPSYPQKKDFLDKVKEECSQIVKILRNHPCLAVWCGGNEFKYKKNKKLIDTLETLCRQNDPSRHFIPISSMNYYYYKCEAWVGQDKRGDSHNNAIWHLCKPFTDYAQDKNPFISEFGHQAVPNLKSLKKFIPEDELWPPGPSWKYHAADLDKLTYFAKIINPEKVLASLDDFILSTQKAQAEALKFAIEHYRRQKYETSGCLFWQFNEPWPSIVWSIIDWYLEPKLSYYAVKNAYSPVLINAEYPRLDWIKGEAFNANIWVINDLHHLLNRCKIECIITNLSGKRFKDFSIEKMNIAEDSSKYIFKLEWLIPKDYPADVFELRLYLKGSDNSVISENKYRFNITDKKERQK